MENYIQVYAPHKSTFKGINANALSTAIYLMVFALSLIPYVQYVVWIFPIMFVFSERDSELVKYSASQCIVISFSSAVINLIIALVGGLFSTASSCIITAVMNVSSAAFISGLHIITFIAYTYFLLNAAKKSSEYIAYRYKFINTFIERFMKL